MKLTLERITLTLYYRVNKAAHDRARRAWINQARRWALDNTKQGDWITVDAVRHGFGEPPWYIDGRNMGHVLRCRNFQRKAYKHEGEKSCRPISYFQRVR